MATMLEFFEATWFIWWIFLSLVILRWFRTIASGRDVDAGLGSSERTGSHSR